MTERFRTMKIFLTFSVHESVSYHAITAVRRQLKFLSHTQVYRNDFLNFYIEIKEKNIVFYNILYLLLF